MAQMTNGASRSTNLVAVFSGRSHNSATLRVAQEEGLVIEPSASRISMQVSTRALWIRGRTENRGFAGRRVPQDTRRRVAAPGRTGCLTRTADNMRAVLAPMRAYPETAHLSSATSIVRYKRGCCAVTCELLVKCSVRLFLLCPQPIMLWGLAERGDYRFLS